MYLAPSTQGSHIVGLFAGVPHQAGDTVSITPDLLLELWDSNKNEWSPWHDYFWMSETIAVNAFDNEFHRDLFLPGLASLLACQDEHPDWINIIMSPSLRTDDNLGVHRSIHPTAGSFTSRAGMSYETLIDLDVGHELFVNCHLGAMESSVQQQQQQRRSSSSSTSAHSNNNNNNTKDRPQHSLEYLQQHGICLDTLLIRPSTIPHIGRGAFSKFAVKTGQPLAITPVVHFDRSQLHRVSQAYLDESSSSRSRQLVLRDHGIEYHADRVLQQQLLLNYCYSHPDSNVLLLPLGPGVHAINHAPSQSPAGSNNNDDAPRANAYVRWAHPSHVPGHYPEGDTVSSRRAALSYFHQLTTHQLFNRAAPMVLGEDSHQLWMEIVALRDIQPNEEIFLDYGRNWQKAWDQHVSTHWPKRSLASRNPNYQSAASYLQQLQQQRKQRYPSSSSATANASLEPWRTVTEQTKLPYPSNLQTACYFKWGDDELGQGDDTASAQHPVTEVEWKSVHFSCLRPCELLERHSELDGDYYTARVYSRPGVATGEYCGKLPSAGLKVTKLPHAAITLVDTPYTSDGLLLEAFRHEIGTPDVFWPTAWMRKDPMADGDFIPTPLKPGEMQVIRWADSGMVVSPNAYRLGLRPKFREVLLEYCDKMGIIDIFKHVTSKGNAFEPGTNTYLELGGEQWYLQRPEARWQSNLQWLSPGDNPAHEDYLQALSAAGFDEMLRGIGTTLQLDSLVAFHVTFIAVSHSVRGYMHYDVTQTQNKTFNVIVPLLLASETGPELDLQCVYEDEVEGTYRTGRYRYEYDVATMMVRWKPFHGLWRGASTICHCWTIGNSPLLLSLVFIHSLFPTRATTRTTPRRRPTTAPRKRCG